MEEVEIEFAVQMSGVNPYDSVKKAIEKFGETKIDEKYGRVMIKSKIPWIEIQQAIEDTGKKAVLTGYGGQSAVAVINDYQNKINGIIRFCSINSENKKCIIDGTVDGLKPGLHGIHIHESGDLSNGFETVGKHYNPNGSLHGAPYDSPDKRHSGDLGNIIAKNDGRATFRLIQSYLSVNEIIGRSIVITENEDDLGKQNTENSLVDGNSGNGLAYGIIAHSAGIFQNYKKLCVCSGRTIWDERDNQNQNII